MNLIKSLLLCAAFGLTGCMTALPPRAVVYVPVPVASAQPAPTVVYYSQPYSDYPYPYWRAPISFGLEYRMGRYRR